MESGRVFDEKDFLSCCGSTKFAQEMVLAGPFSDCQQAIDAARDIWFEKVDVNGWLEAFATHPKIGESPSQKGKSSASANWSKGEQSTALATATDSSLQELVEWNARYRQKFGFIFLICAAGRSTPEILGEMKRRYHNRPLAEFEIAAQEQMKITELRLSKLFSVTVDAAPKNKAEHATNIVTKAGEDRMSVIGAHFPAASEVSVKLPSPAPPRTRPPITTHVLDTARGSPAIGIEVQLEYWVGNEPPSVFHQNIKGDWIVKARTMTDKDGRSGPMFTQDEIFNPGLYRISFNTGKYNPDGFFPYVSIVFEVRESQMWQHFHVPLLLSPFAFSTYRGS
ncbi:OLC1v1001834C1 [Oldenlandia corymbosa var. corymbosa]|uniref:OLC1v1001834C1 n=1 Tax=Oldenlandia corymbosa var. corymbosa TaxID=529605 RepID=A0AAV1D667_OLDCO|nr:OLC1v1001834C1 [Oldenlandia corymbosa var. corymbosa]